MYVYVYIHEHGKFLGRYTAAHDLNIHMFIICLCIYICKYTVLHIYVYISIYMYILKYICIYKYIYVYVWSIHCRP